MKSLRALNKYLWRYRWRLLLGIFFVVGSNYFRVWQPRVIRQALDYVLEKLKLHQAASDAALKDAIYSEVSQSLMTYGLTVLGLALSMGIFMYFMRQTIVVMSRLIEYDMRKDIFEKYQSLDTTFFKKHQTGDLMSRITEDVSKVRMYLGPGILYSINLISLFILAISSMLTVNVKMTLYVLIPLPILSVAIYFVSDVINRRSVVIQRQLAKLNSISQEVFSGIRVIKSYVQESAFSKYFLSASNEYKDHSMKLAQVNALFFPMVVLLIGVSNIIVIYMGSLEYATGRISAGNIAEFIIYVNMLTWPVTAIGWIASIVQQAAASQTRINEYMRAESAITFLDNGRSQHLQGHIVFENVSFIYPNSGIKALENVSFEIKPGEKVGIIGQTASGKTTLAELILRLYNVSKGRILIDGQNINDVDLSVLRSKIGYVPQDVFLFSDTVENNIGFGLSQWNSQTIKKYAEYASVHDDIMDFSDGYDTVIGERGVMLSGGQKQRLSIARALIKKPEIVILDDCLSAVDTKTEEKIVQFLSDELADKTAIIITHRIHHALGLDKILVLENGQLLQYGNPLDLANEDGYYKTILNEFH